MFEMRRLGRVGSRARSRDESECRGASQAGTRNGRKVMVPHAQFFLIIRLSEKGGSIHAAAAVEPARRETRSAVILAKR